MVHIARPIQGPAINRISLPRGYQIDADDIIPVIQMTSAVGAVDMLSATD